MKAVQWHVASGPTGEFDEIQVGQGRGLVLYAKRVNHDQWIVEVDGERMIVTLVRGVARITGREKAGA